MKGFGWVHHAGRFSPRRRLVLATAGLATAGLGWWTRQRAHAYTPEAVMHALCDRMLPATGEHVGAIALGIDRVILDQMHTTRRNNHLKGLFAAMRQAHFLDLPPAAQDATLRRMLDDRDHIGTARMLQHVLRLAVREYLSRPEAWPALGYRKPQPLGYPDYAGCAGAHAERAT